MRAVGLKIFLISCTLVSSGVAYIFFFSPVTPYYEIFGIRSITRVSEIKASSLALWNKASIRMRLKVPPAVFRNIIGAQFQEIAPPNEFENSAGDAGTLKWWKPFASRSNLFYKGKPLHLHYRKTNDVYIGYDETRQTAYVFWTGID